MLGIGYAQTEIADLTPIKKGEEPKAVLNTLKQDFPGVTASEFNFISHVLYGQKWSEKVSGELVGDMKLVQVNVRDKNGNYEILFDKDGKVLKIKDFIKNAELPPAVMKSIRGKYPSFKLLTDSEKISAGRDRKAQVVYRAEIQSAPNGKKRNLFLDNSGKLLRDSAVPLV